MICAIKEKFYKRMIGNFKQNCFVKIHGKKFWSLIMNMFIQNPCYNEVYYKGTALYKWPKRFNLVFLHGNSLPEAVWSRKFHVQIMKITCCLNMAFTWKSLNWALICFHDVTQESVAAWLIIYSMLSFAKTLHAYIWCCGDVMTLESLTLTPFCFEKSSVRKWIFNV